ncbi:MAG: hypothetical protein XE08_0370 [Parcubacteria bacterium 32_520]|nr:MAG: hypothetical protein XE08_0370 [Parcubacteria bacterium 32_520]
MIIKLLSTSNYCIYNKSIGKRLSPIAAIILSVLCDKMEYFRKTDGLTKKNQLVMIEMDFDGVMKEVPCFYFTRPKMEEETGISEYQQNTAEKLLIQKGIIKKRDCGMPKRNYYYIDEQALETFLREETEV